MELNSSVNTFIGGMNLDLDVSLLKENQYQYAENIRLLTNKDGTTGVLLNRDCLKKFNSFLRNDENILGTVVTRVYKDGGSKECIVVVTKYNNKNSIYIIFIDDSTKEITIQTFLLDANIGWDNELNIVANYESDTVSKIYVADGKHYIKIINLNAEYNADEINDETFDIAPNTFLKKPILLKTVPGNLEVGALLYAYQLFTKHGAESVISPVSEIINIPKMSGVSSTDVFGGNKGELSNIGCAIKIDFESNKIFDYIRLYRIRYDSNNSVSNVYIITETEIHGNNIVYNDKSDSFISEITVDEFNALTLKTFVPKTLEKHENRLFAANIKEDIWDIGEYDARAYRCDINGNVKLNHSDINLNITAKMSDVIKEGFVPKNHDCINPSNELLFEDGSFEYIYYMKDNQPVIGGEGVNVLYEFCFTNVLCNEDEPLVANGRVYPAYSLDLKVSEKENYRVKVTDINNNILCTKTLANQSIIPNYSDSWFTSNFLGYQRDEIYRFGIVFYNKKGQHSNVCWIGDIRIPSSNVEHAENYDKLKTFYLNDSLLDERPDPDSPAGELIANALGIKFTIKNIPDGAVSWEIVRCPRTELDRTIVTQAYLSKLITFNDSWNDDIPTYGESDIRPMALLNTGEYYRTHNFEKGSELFSEFATVENYYELISPEICVQKDGIVDNIKSGKLCSMYFAKNEWKRSYSDIYYSSDTMWGVRQSRIYTLSDEKEELQYNNYGLGSYKSKDGVPYFAFGITRGSETGDYAHPDMYGGALLLKYYDIYEKRNGVPLKASSVKDAIYPTQLPLIYDGEEAKEYSRPIGTKIYVNTTVGGENQLNTHGQCVIVNTSELVSTASDNLTAAVVNVKQTGLLYGGSNYANRTNSVYMPCTSHSVDLNTVCVFGGDTYIGVFDYVHTSMKLDRSDASYRKSRSLFINCYLPIESTVNMYLFNNDSYKNTVNGRIGLNLLLSEPTVTSNYAQTRPLYEYNSAYSTDANAQVFVPELLYTDENPIFETRITCSELKTNNEIIDSWTKFKFANYLDVDNQYGKLTNLKSFKGKLLFWQDSSVGVASVNERSLIQDNNISLLTLGTGGILVRYDYYTTLNGSYIINDKSICNSASTLYWYDTDKHEICAINNNVIELSKNKGVKSWCNKLLDRTNTIGWYNWKYNEILFQNKSEDKNRSIVFNEQLNVFTGFYTYPVTYAAQMINNVITFDEFGNMYIHNSDINYEPFESKLTYKINKGYPETKVFDNVWFDAEFSTNEVLKSVVFKTKTQETNPISFNDIENREDTYRFPIPRDKNGVARMRGKYLICDYTFDCINDGDFKIPYIKTTFRISKV